MKFALIFLALVAGIAKAGYEPTPHPFDVQNYHWSFDLDPSQTPGKLTATLKMDAIATSPIQEVTLHAKELLIHQIAFGTGKSKLGFEHSNEKGLLKVTLPKKVSKGEPFQLSIVYDAKVNESHDGIFKVTDPDEPSRGTLYFTMFEAESARTAYPCFDEPHDKATTEVTATIPSTHQMISNGKLLSDRPITRGEQKWHVVHWKTTQPHATYLVSFGIGPFQKLSTLHRGKEISVLVGKSKQEKARYALDTTVHSIQFFEKYLGTPYPWPKYATVGVPTYLWGGMENTSSTHMNQERMLINDSHSAFEKRRLTNLAAHELAHQWFGDYVTMRWWNDIWLNESFATYMAMLAQKDAFKNEEAEMESLLYLWDDYFREENGPRSHPIVSESIQSPGDGFDSTNYTKGSAVLRMLTSYLGEENFRKGVKTYLSKFAYANSDYKDFFSIMAKSSKENLDAFRDGWLLKRGYPVVEYSGKWAADKKAYELWISQRPNHPEDNHLFRFRLPVVFHRNSPPSYAKTITVDMSGDEQLETVALPASPEWITVNPNGEVLAKVAPKESSERTLGLVAHLDPNPIARLWANISLLDNFKQGNELTDYAEKTVIKTLNEDTSPYVRLGVLSWIQQSKNPKTPNPLGAALLALAKESQSPSFLTSSRFLSDEHGWRQWRSELIGTLGKVDSSEVPDLLESILKQADLPLDDLQTASRALAMTGKKSVSHVLSEALALHGKRGYRYRYHLAMAFAAYESPKAAEEIRKIAQTATADLMGKIGGPVSHNETLRKSTEWAEFVRDFVVTDNRFGEEIKSRMLETIEDTKTSAIEEALKMISKEASSQRIRELSEKILKKNFPKS